MGGIVAKNSNSKVRQHIEVSSIDDFAAEIVDANEMARVYVDSTGSYLSFLIKDPESLRSGPLSAQLPFICVECLKLSKNDGLIWERQLSVTQFYLVYFRLKDHFNAENWDASIWQSNFNPEKPTGKGRTEEENDCIICMSEQADVILPCTHAYCHNCIHRWSLTSKECPTCRRPCCDDEESWIITPRPDCTEMAEEVHEFTKKMSDDEGGGGPRESF